MADLDSTLTRSYVPPPGAGGMTPIPGLGSTIPALGGADAQSLMAYLGGGSVSAEDKKTASEAFDKANAGEFALAQKQQKESEDLIARVKSATSEEINVLKGLNPPTLDKPKSAPEEAHTDPWKTWGSPAMWVATFGGLFTRQHAVTALNAAAGVMDAVNKGDAEETAHRMDVWKTENENMLKYAQFEQKAYEDAMSKGENVLSATLDAMKNEVGAQALANGQWSQYYQDLTSRNKTLLDASVKSYAAQARAAGSQGMTDADYQKFREDPKNIVLADAYAAGTPPSEIVRGLGAQSGLKLDAIQRLAVERHPNLDLTKAQLEFGEKKRELSAFAIRSAPAQIAVREIDNLADPMINAMKKLDPVKYPDLNSLQNAIKARTGDPDVKAAALAIQEFKTAFTNLMVRNGVPTDNARSRSDELMNINFNLSQAEAIKTQAQISAGAVIDALHSAKEDIEGEKSGVSSKAPQGVDPEDWKYLTPEQRKLWQTSP